jgi:tetratricopeptide (TPR) repeat protein
MREVRGWRSNRLAKALGMTPGSLYEYESGRMTPSRELLERAAAKMGSPAHLVDRTLTYLRLSDAEAALGATTGEAHRELQQVAAEMGLELEERIVAMGLRLEARLCAFMERRTARWLWERLRSHPAERRRSIVRENPEFHSWGLSELLCHLSIEAAADSAGEAVHRAELALLVARLVPGPETWRRRVQGYAGAHLGNAHRVRGDLPAADQAFHEALPLWQAGAAGDPEGLLDESSVLGLEASVRRDQRRLPEALDLLDRALVADKDGARRGRLLIKRAKTLEELDRYDEAVATLQEAIPLVDGERDPRLLWSLRFNLLENLYQVGRRAEAEGMLDGVRELALRLGNELDLVHLTWLDGRLAALRGEAGTAEAAFEQVRQDLLARGIGFDTAMVTLELVVLYLRESRTAEVRELSLQLAPVFHAQGVSREALATVRLFCDAVEKETITMEMAQRLLEDLRRAGA